MIQEGGARQGRFAGLRGAPGRGIDLDNVLPGDAVELVAVGEAARFVRCHCVPARLEAAITFDDAPVGAGHGDIVVGVGGEAAAGDRNDFFGKVVSFVGRDDGGGLGTIVNSEDTARNTQQPNNR